MGFDLAHEEPERWNGKVQQDGNLGRTDGLVGLSVGRSFGPVDANASISTPVFQRVRGGQLDYPAIVGFSLYRSIGSVPK